MQWNNKVAEGLELGFSLLLVLLDLIFDGFRVV